MATMTFSRPIDRLPMKKTANEHKEAMNCKSCRKRKIKCNRLKPSCEACQVFNCACIYDAIPKKRGPKTDVLEALLKRVNGLEKRLKDEQKSSASPEQETSTSTKEEERSEGMEKSQSPPVPSPPLMVEAQQPRPEIRRVQSNPVPIEPAPQIHEALAFTDALLDTFFARVHNKPYYILDESATRQRLRDGRLPRFLINAIHAVSVRYVPHLCGGHTGAMRSSHDYVVRSRAEIDVDEPSIDNLQALLLLAMANFQNGKGKRCYMLLNHAVSMSFALNLHRELPAELRIAKSEREGRRKLFWSCYLMDRFAVSGSKRPSLISDEAIHLRLPGWQEPANQPPGWVEGSFFPNGSSLPHVSGANASQGSGTMLVEIVRILGVTNRYLGAGGVKGDSHFPWHAQSTLSRIRSDLDYWAAATQEIFTSIDTLFGSQDSPTLVLSKLIYHLIHCLIYRPFLPIDLSELSGSGQNNSWQIEATNLCFLHANAIAELVEIGKNTALLDWPSFVGYCICTAGTIHVHGAHYMSYRDGDAFCHSAEFLAREMAQLTELRTFWAGIQHQRDTLQIVYANHAQLVKSLSSNPMRFSRVFQMEDFFDRYPDSYIDGAHCTFQEVVVDMLEESPMAYDGFHVGADPWVGMGHFYPEATMPSQPQPQPQHLPRAERKRKRRSTTSSLPYPTPKADAGAIMMPESIEEEPFEQLRHQEQQQQQAGTSSEQSILDTHDRQQQQPQHQQQNPMLYQGSGTFTPGFAFSPVQSALEQSGGGCGEMVTPNGEPTNDPFLSLLEQMAESDASGLGGQRDFDFL